MRIAIDFDGTIVEHKYPQIGREIPFAIATLKQLQAERHLLILWSVREGELLDEAVDFCRKRGLEFYAVNSNMPEEEADMSALRSPEGVCRYVHRRPQLGRTSRLGRDIRDDTQPMEL